MSLSPAHMYIPIVVVAIPGFFAAVGIQSDNDNVPS